MCAITTFTFKNMKMDSPTRTVLINKCQPKIVEKNDALWSSSDLAPSPLSSRLCKRYPMTQIKQYPSGVSQILGRVWFLTWFTLFLGAGTAAIELYTPSSIPLLLSHGRRSGRRNGFLSSQIIGLGTFGDVLGIGGGRI